MSKMRPTLEEFLEYQKKPGSVRNVWLQGRHYDFYVRRSVRMIGNERVSTFDLASLSVHHSHQGKGILTSFIHKVAKICDYDYIYVESVLNIQLRDWLIRKGFTRDDRTSELSPGFYIKIADARRLWEQDPVVVRRV